MRISESWRTIGSSLAHDPEIYSPPWPVVTGDRHAHCWHVLFSDSSRSLIVPSRNRHAQRRSVQFFLIRPLNRFYAQCLLEVNRLLPRLRLLPELTLPPLDGLSLLDDLQLPPTTQVAFQVGTPGPYQKVSMLIMADSGEPLALIKLALKESANAMVMRETQWLRELARHEPLLGKMPRLLTHGSVRNGRAYLSLSVAPSKATTNAFTPAHAAFLTELANVDVITAPFTSSPAYRYLTDTVTQLRLHMSTSMAALLTDGLDQCVERLTPWEGPQVLAHGDFAPWNIRLHGDDIFVFDWEYAAAGSIALHDVFHFCLAPRALAGHINVKHLTSILAQAQDFAREAHPQFSWERPIVAAQCLGYLLHTVLYYSASRGRVIEDHPVIKAYCKLIEERRRWID